jgi:hypothetical protein
MINACSDEARIIIVDTIEPQGQNEVVRGSVGAREHSRTQVSPMENYNPRGAVPSSSSQVTGSRFSIPSCQLSVLQGLVHVCVCVTCLSCC